MKKINISTKKYPNTFAIVDEDIFEELNKFKWYPHNKYVARTNKTLLMHRVVMNCPKGLYVDHINHNTLDNRKENLRVCTNAENCRNSRRGKLSSSKYKGVSWYKQTKRWQCGIMFNKRKIHIGYFINEKQAAIEYNKKAKELFGEFAYLNDLQDDCKG